MVEALTAHQNSQGDEDTGEETEDEAPVAQSAQSLPSILDELADDPEEDGDEDLAPSGSVVDGQPISNDRPVAPDAALSLHGGEEGDTLSGLGGDDDLTGNDGADFLTGRAGDDSLSGGAGHDYLDAGEGEDELSGDAGNDILIAGAGNDVLSGGEGDDSLAGQSGDDTLFGGQGDDTLMGGEGQDALDGGDGDDWLHGGAGGDRLMGGHGQDTLDGGDGNDTLSGADDLLRDFLNGGAGDDLIFMGAGDSATGGAGHDHYVFTEYPVGGDVAVIEDFDPGQDDLVVLVDGQAVASGSLTLVAEEGSQDATLMLDGVALALIKGGASLSVDALHLHAA